MPHTHTNRPLMPVSIYACFYGNISNKQGALGLVCHPTHKLWPGNQIVWGTAKIMQSGPKLLILYIKSSLVLTITGDSLTFGSWKPSLSLVIDRVTYYYTRPWEKPMDYNNNNEKQSNQPHPVIHTRGGEDRIEYNERKWRPHFWTKMIYVILYI